MGRVGYYFPACKYMQLKRGKQPTLQVCDYPLPSRYPELLCDGLLAALKGNDAAVDVDVGDEVSQGGCTHS